VKKTISILLLLTALNGCAEKAAFHREYRDRIARASTEEERHHNELEYRLLSLAEKGSLSAHFNALDGVTEFEAWLLAKTYAGEEIGACLDLGLPVLRARGWEVRTLIGRPAKEGPPVVIDARSGKITCEGYPSVERPLEYLTRFEAKFKTPNQSLEPTSGSVTPRASSSTSK
jgi:hypothetical protein